MRCIHGLVGPFGAATTYTQRPRVAWFAHFGVISFTTGTNFLGLCLGFVTDFAIEKKMRPCIDVCCRPYFGGRGGQIIPGPRNHLRQRQTIFGAAIGPGRAIDARRCWQVVLVVLFTATYARCKCVGCFGATGCSFGGALGALTSTGCTGVV